MKGGGEGCDRSRGCTKKWKGKTREMKLKALLSALTRFTERKREECRIKIEVFDIYR